MWDNFYVVSLQVLTKKKQNTRRVYEDSRTSTPPPPLPSSPKANKKFQSYLQNYLV